MLKKLQKKIYPKFIIWWKELKKSSNYNDLPLYQQIQTVE